MFFDPGLGKTLTTLTLLDTLKPACTWIIAPLRVARETWPTEIERWGFKDLDPIVVHGKTKKAGIKAKTYIFNPEGLEWAVENLPLPEILVVDESSMFKNPSSVRFKAL